jgi:hypothetical protein
MVQFNVVCQENHADLLCRQAFTSRNAAPARTPYRNTAPQRNISSSGSMTWNASTNNLLGSLTANMQRAMGTRDCAFAYFG